MQLTRRNTLLGLGTIVAGGGAAIGSGAFSQTEAERAITVEIVDENNVAEEYVDIRVDTDSDNVEVRNEADDVQTPEDLFPIDDTNVSLVSNEVGIAFISLLGGSTARFDDLFTIVNENDEGESDDFTVTFEHQNSDIVAGFVEGDGEPEDEVTITSEAGEDDETLGIVVDTSGVEGSETDNEALLITITPVDDE